MTALDSIQGLLHAGHSTAARRQIRALAGRRLKDRKAVLKLAFLARQASLSEITIGLLYRTVRVKDGGRTATEEEKAEYGLGLAYLGFGAEAIGILSQLDGRKLPRAYYGLAVALFRRWDHLGGLPYIAKYLKCAGVSLYDRFWGRLLLARALLHGTGEHEKARELLVDLIAQTREHQYLAVLREAQLALAWAHCYARRFPLVFSTLGEIEVPPDHIASHSGVWAPIETLRAEAALFAAPKNAKALAHLLEVRDRYARLGHWERARECDFHGALASRSESLLAHVYFGTPYVGGRQSLLREGRLSETDIPATYEWLVPGDNRRERREVLDLRTGRTQIKHVAFKPGQTPIQVIRALSMDFYQPPKLATLFERLYPGEYFHPTAAVLRLRQAIFQTRKWLKENGVPLQIAVDRDRYRLTSPLDFRLVIERPGARDETSAPRAAAEESLHTTVARAAELFDGREFSSHEFARHQGVSERSARRSLKEAVSLGLLEASPRRAFYRVKR